MANRKLYKLELSGDAIIVYRTDNNYGRQGVIFKDGTIRKEYTPYALPQYIQREAFNILNADSFELRRGYTYGGYRCRLILNHIMLVLDNLI